jgi:hypothetical protein
MTRNFEKIYKLLTFNTKKSCLNDVYFLKKQYFCRHKKRRTNYVLDT